MKCLFGVLALSAAFLAVVAEPEADPHYYPHYPYGHGLYYAYRRPYAAASGYAGALPGHSYQAVHRLHKREAEAEAEAEADPQLILGAALPALPALHPYSVIPAGPAAVLPVPAAAAAVHTAVQSVPVVKSVVQIPAAVTHHQYAPTLTYAAAPTTSYVTHHHAAPVPAAAAVVAGGHTVVAGLSSRDCVTEAGCAVRAALLTGAPAAAYGSAAVIGRRYRRDADAEPTAEAEAEAEADADADADAAYLYGTAYNGYYGGAFPYSLPYSSLAYNHFGYNNLAYNTLPYNNFAYNYSPLSYLNNYYAAVAPAAAPVAVEAAAPAPVVAAAHISAPYAAVPHVEAAVPYVAPAYVATPKVATVAKEVTYTHLGAHPIPATTVLQTESQLVY